MTNIVENFEKEHMAELTAGKEIPSFKAGDTVRVSMRVIDGASERIQNYEGVVIAVRNRGVNSSFMVRKVSHGEGVERRFMTYSPLVDSIKVIKRGVVRRAKLFYLRERSGKSARIKEKQTFHKKPSPAAAVVAETSKSVNTDSAAPEAKASAKSEAKK